LILNRMGKVIPPPPEAQPSVDTPSDGAPPALPRELPLDEPLELPSSSPQ
jgi:hypothetical protein